MWFRAFFFSLFVVLSNSVVFGSVTGVAFKEYTFGTTEMSARIEVTDTTTQAQRDARKFSFSWTARLTKVFGTGTNGAQTSVQFAAMTTANNGAFYSYATLASLSSNSTYDQTFTGNYVAPNPYVAGTQYVDIKLRAAIVGPSSQYGDYTMRIPLTDTLPQTITATPLTGTVDLGLPFHLTVTGNENELVFSRAMEVGAGAGSYFFNPDVVGTHIFHVYAAAGNGYLQSNTLTFTVNVKGYRVNVSLPANTSKYMTSYEVKQSGETIVTLVQLAGAAARTQMVDVPTNQPVTITPYISGIREDGSVFVEDTEGTHILQPTTVQPTTIEDPADEPEPTPSVSIDGAPKDPTDSGDKSVWSQTDEEGTEAKDKTVKEGVDKIVDSLDEINNTLKARLPGAGSGGGTDMSGVEGRLDDLLEIERARDEANKVETPTTLQDAQAAAQNAPAYEGPKINSGTPTATGISSFTPTLGQWEIVPGRTITISLLPDGIWSGASSILSACKPLILWAAVIAFICSCGSVLDGYVQSLPQVNAATAAVGIENAVPGVAQGKTWTAAALLVGAMVVAAAVFVGYVQTAASANGVGLSNLFSALNLSSIGGGLGLIEQYLPVGALLSLAVLRAGFSYVCAPAYMLATSAMKFFQA